MCCACCLLHQLNWRDCNELSLLAWPDPGLVSRGERRSAENPEIRTAIFYSRIWETCLPRLSSFWKHDRGHCFGISQQRSVQGANWKVSLDFKEQRNTDANLEREDLSRMWNWDQKADQGSRQLQELAALFVSLMVCTIPLSWFLCLSSKICLLYFPLFINRPVPQSKCQKELVPMTLLIDMAPLGRVLCQRHRHEPLGSSWTGCLRPGACLDPLSGHWCTVASLIQLSWSRGLWTG